MRLADRDPQYAQIVGELRVRRQALGLSQEDLADRLGVRRDTVCTWENGRRMPNAEVLFTWCRVLEIQVRAHPLYRSPSKDLYIASSYLSRSAVSGALS